MSLTISMNNIFESIHNQLLQSGRLDWETGNKVRQAWANQQYQVEQQLLAAHRHTADMNNQLHIPGQVVMQAVNAFVEQTLTYLRRPAPGYGVPNYGIAPPPLPGYGPTAPVQMGSGFPPVAGRHGTPVQDNTILTPTTTTDDWTKTKKKPVLQNTSGGELPNFNIKDISVTPGNKNFPDLMDIDGIIKCSDTHTFTVSKDFKFQYYVLQQTIPEDDDDAMVKHFSSMKTSPNNFVLDIKYPKYLILNAEASIMRDLRPKMKAILESDNFIEKGINLIKSQSYNFVLEIEKVIVPEINKWLALTLITQTSKVELRIAELSDILELFSIREPSLDAFIKHDRYRARLSSIVRHVFAKYFTNVVVLDPRYDMELMIASKLVIREPHYHKCIKFKDLTDENREAHYARFDKYTVLCVSNNVLYTNILPNSMLHRLRSGKEGAVHTVEYVTNTLDAVLATIMADRSLKYPISEKEFFSLKAYNWSNDMSIYVKVGESLDGMLTMYV